MTMDDRDGVIWRDGKYVPWQDYPDWRADPDFVAKVAQKLETMRPDSPPQDVPVLAICRSGARSMAAARVLAEAGFGQVYNIREGFEGDRDADRHRGTVNGWRFHGLPWEQT